MVQQCLGERIAESGVGLLVFTVTHMARTRLIRSLTTEIDEVTEGRFALAPLIGEDLAALRGNRHDQRAAFHARAIAEAVAPWPETPTSLAGEGDRSASAVGMGRGRRWRWPHGCARRIICRAGDLERLGDYRVPPVLRP